MAYTRGRDGAESYPVATNTISDRQWESLNRRRAFETDDEYDTRAVVNDANRQKAEES